VPKWIRKLTETELKWSIYEITVTRLTEMCGEKIIPVPICPPQIPDALDSREAQASAT
jgi:hypothetical protein